VAQSSPGAQVTSRREAKRLALSLFWNVRADFSRRAAHCPLCEHVPSRLTEAAAGPSPGVTILMSPD